LPNSSPEAGKAKRRRLAAAAARIIAGSTI
jgi:hypothetical protein